MANGSLFDVLDQCINCDISTSWNARIPKQIRGHITGIVHEDPTNKIVPDVTMIVTHQKKEKALDGGMETCSVLLRTWRMHGHLQ